MSANMGSGGEGEIFVRDRDWCFEFGAKLEEKRTELASKTLKARFG